MVLIFKRGQDFLEELKKILKAEEIGGRLPVGRQGFFYGLGALNNAELAFYDLENKRYLNQKFEDGPYEVLSLSGNVAEKEGDLAVHCHVVLGKKDFSTFGGHLVNAEVGGTLELFFEPFSGLKRKLDKATGLYLCEKS